MQKTIIKNNTPFIFYILIAMIHILLLSNCSDKQKKESNDTLDINTTNTFIIKSNNTTYDITLQDKKILLNKTPHTLILLNLLDTTCSTCAIHANTLKNLERTNRGLQVLNITQSTQDTENIHFVNEIYKTLNLPKDTFNMLSILYVNGKYYQHYEGRTPIEMIQYDIQTSNTN